MEVGTNGWEGEDGLFLEAQEECSKAVIERVARCTDASIHSLHLEIERLRRASKAEYLQWEGKVVQWYRGCLSFDDLLRCEAQLPAVKRLFHPPLSPPSDELQTIDQQLREACAHPAWQRLEKRLRGCLVEPQPFVEDFLLLSYRHFLGSLTQELAKKGDLFDESVTTARARFQARGEHLLEALKELDPLIDDLLGRGEGYQLGFEEVREEVAVVRKVCQLLAQRKECTSQSGDEGDRVPPLRLLPLGEEEPSLIPASEGREEIRSQVEAGRRSRFIRASCVFAGGVVLILAGALDLFLPLIKKIHKKGPHFLLQKARGVTAQGPWEMLTWPIRVVTWPIRRREGAALGGGALLIWGSNSYIRRLETEIEERVKERLLPRTSWVPPHLLEAEEAIALYPLPSTGAEQNEGVCSREDLWKHLIECYPRERDLLCRFTKAPTLLSLQARTRLLPFLLAPSLYLSTLSTNVEKSKELKEKLQELVRSILSKCTKEGVSESDITQLSELFLHFGNLPLMEVVEPLLHTQLDRLGRLSPSNEMYTDLCALIRGYQQRDRLILAELQKFTSTFLNIKDLPILHQLISSDLPPSERLRRLREGWALVKRESPPLVALSALFLLTGAANLQKLRELADPEVITDAQFIDVFVPLVAQSCSGLQLDHPGGHALLRKNFRLFGVMLLRTFASCFSYLLGHGVALYSADSQVDQKVITLLSQSARTLEQLDWRYRAPLPTSDHSSSKKVTLKTKAIDFFCTNPVAQEMAVGFGKVSLRWGLFLNNTFESGLNMNQKIGDLLDRLDQKQWVARQVERLLKSSKEWVEREINPLISPINRVYRRLYAMDLLLRSSGDQWNQKELLSLLEGACPIDDPFTELLTSLLADIKILIVQEGASLHESLANRLKEVSLMRSAMEELLLLQRDEMGKKELARSQQEVHQRLQLLQELRQPIERLRNQEQEDAPSQALLAFELKISRQEKIFESLELFYSSLQELKKKTSPLLLRILNWVTSWIGKMKEEDKKCVGQILADCMNKRVKSCQELLSLHAAQWASLSSEKSGLMAVYWGFRNWVHTFYQAPALQGLEQRFLRVRAMTQLECSIERAGEEKKGLLAGVMQRETGDLLSHHQQREWVAQDDSPEAQRVFDRSLAEALLVYEQMQWAADYLGEPQAPSLREDAELRLRFAVQDAERRAQARPFPSPEKLKGEIVDLCHAIEELRELHQWWKNAQDSIPHSGTWKERLEQEKEEAIKALFEQVEVEGAALSKWMIDTLIQAIQMAEELSRSVDPNRVVTN